MGSWGYGIRHDDFVCDVIGEFEDALKSRKTLAEAAAAVTMRFSAAIEDTDSDPLFWIALADVQWAHGALEPSVLQRVRNDFATGRSLLGWEEDPRGLVKRLAVLDKFISKLDVPKAKPARGARTTIRAPKFGPGK